MSNEIDALIAEIKERLAHIRKMAEELSADWQPVPNGFERTYTLDEIERYLGYRDGMLFVGDKLDGYGIPLPDDVRLFVKGKTAPSREE